MPVERSSTSQPDLPTVDAVREIAVRAAEIAGEVLLAGFGRVEQLRFKGDVDLVTEVDERSERAIVDLLMASFPTHRVLAEEGSVGGDDASHRWVVDPLDGTTNYAHGLPFFCVSIAYERDGQLEIGIVFDPLRDEMFVAQRGHGAQLNGQPLAVTNETTLLRSLLATGFPYDRTLMDRALRMFGLLSRRSRAVRRLGSAALDSAYVAAGRLDGYWEASIKAWDVAAGALLVAEAGGLVTTLSGAPFSLEHTEIVASNGAVHQRLLEAIAEADRGD